MAGMLISMAFTLLVIAYCSKHLEDLAERKRLAERELTEVRRRGSCLGPRLHIPDELADVVCK